MTSDECVAYLGFPPQTRIWAGARKRLSDLMNYGYLEDTGDRAPGRSGRLQIIRAITDAGERALGNDD